MPRINEAKTRKELIDPALERAGWHLRDESRVGLEIPVDGYDAQPWNGVTDYCLYRANGEVLAVVEAKRTTHDARLALADLYQEPLTNFGEDAVDRWFSPADVNEIVAFANQLAV